MIVKRKDILVLAKDPIGALDSTAIKAEGDCIF